MKLNLTQKDLVGIILGKLAGMGKVERRVVNPADPTEVKTIKVRVGVEYGFRDLVTSDEEQNYPPAPELVDVKVVSSWGDDFTITTLSGTFRAYFNPENQKWVRVSKNFMIMLKRILTDGISEREFNGLGQENPDEGIYGGP